MALAYLGLGSNLGDRVAHLRAGVGMLPGVVAVSPVYETAPVGGWGGQQDYLNLVVEVRTGWSPHRLLRACWEAERAAGRVRWVRWGARSLDVDVLLYDRWQVRTPDLAVPHPRMWERRFVLAPLRDLAPGLVPQSAVDAADGEVRQVGPLESL